MNVSLFALASVLIISTADQQKLRRRELGEKNTQQDNEDGKFNHWQLPSNVVVRRDPILVASDDKFNGKFKANDKTDEHDAPPNEGKDDPMSDVRQVAKMARLSVEEARLLLNQQQEFSELATILQQDDKSFLQTEMPPGLDGDFVIKVKGGELSSEGVAALRKFAKKHAKAEVKVDNSRLSLQDAEDRAERLSKILEEKEYVQVSYTIDGDAVDIEAKKPPNDESRDMGDIPKDRMAEIFGLDPKDEILLDVVLVLIDFNDRDIAEPLHTYGGRRIYGSGSCTTAFSVIKNSNGAGGVATAGHCDGMTTYDAVPPEVDYALTSTSEHEGKWGDLQWHQTGHVEPAEYYSYPTTRWPVRSIATSISKGEWVCVYSRMRGSRRCDKVFKTSVSVNYSCCPKMKKLVAMEGNYNIPGDSGGPWSYYDKAYGIVSGAKTICNFLFFGCSRRDLWSRVSYLDDALGVRVRT